MEMHLLKHLKVQYPIGIGLCPSETEVSHEIKIVKECIMKEELKNTIVEHLKQSLVLTTESIDDISESLIDKLGAQFNIEFKPTLDDSIEE